MAKTSKHPQRKAVIFAGGVGTRMWPLSREATPKQFEKIVEGKSTLQMSVERLLPEFAYNDIYISTGSRYLELVAKQVPQIPVSHIIGEPQMRDVGAAIGYVMSILEQKYPNVPTAILWSDHLVNNVDQFKQALESGAQYLNLHPDKIVFLGQKPRFASQNLGWIHLGNDIDQINGLNLKAFKDWHYRPDFDTAQKYFESGQYAWNPGYFIVTPKLVMEKFKQYAQPMYVQLVKLGKSYGSPSHSKLLSRLYPSLEKISFDNLILEKITSQEAVVISVDLGWSDIGAWEALKEALQSSPEENVVQGNVRTKNTTDSLIYSYTDQLVSTIDIESLVVVVTSDVILITKKDSIPEVKKMVNELKEEGLEHYT